EADDADSVLRSGLVRRALRNLQPLDEILDARTPALRIHGCAAPKLLGALADQIIIGRSRQRCSATPGQWRAGLGGRGLPADHATYLVAASRIPLIPGTRIASGLRPDLPHGCQSSSYDLAELRNICSAGAFTAAAPHNEIDH